MAKRIKKDHLIEASALPVHSLVPESSPIQVLSLDHTNPYDYKREHRHTYYEIMLIENGGGNQLIDFRDYQAQDNSCYIIYPQQVHLMNRKNSTGVLIQFTDECVFNAELLTTLKQLSMKDNAAIIFEDDKDAHTEISALFKLIKNQIFAENPGSRQVSGHLLQALISLIIVYAGNKDYTTLAPDKKLLFEFYELLEKHYAENRGVQFFARQLATTDKKLSAATRMHTGQTPLQLIHNRVVLEAKRLLLFQHTSHKEISFQLGFDSPATFSAFIKTKTGHSPSELAAQLSEIHK